MHHEGPNYTSDRATVRVFEDDRQIAVLHPEKRLYTVQMMPMTEAGIDAGLFRDLYVALGEPLDRRRLGRAPARQTVRALDLAGRSDDGPGRRAGRAGSALSRQGQEPGARSAGHDRSTNA